MVEGLPSRISQRAEHAGVVVPAPLAAALTKYIELLARWNRSINLTALDVEGVGDEVIDRLLVEPLAAARRVLPSDWLCMDLGSGGGSPAIPFKLAVPALRLVMVESRTRKCAFLQEAVRHLGLDDVEVVNERVESLLARDDFCGRADLVTVRALRVDDGLLEAARTLLRLDGRLFLFGSSGAAHTLPRQFVHQSDEPLLRGLGSRLTVAAKAS